jgi:hypothetical protein
MARKWNGTLEVSQLSELLNLNQDDIQWLVDAGRLETVSIGGRDFADASDVADMEGGR